VCSHQLRVQSSFTRPLTGVGVNVMPPDDRFRFDPGSASSDILPSSSSYIGELRWDPWIGCGAQCHLGIPKNQTRKYIYKLGSFKSSNY